MLLEQILRILTGLLIGVWVARHLGPLRYGIFSYSLAFAAIFTSVAKLGLDGIIVRELVSNPSKRDLYLGTSFWLKLLGSLISIGLITAILPLTDKDTVTTLYIYLFALSLVFQSFEVVEFYFQARVMAKIVSICKITQLATSSIIKIYLLIIEAELIWFVLVTTFDALSLAITYFIAYRLQKNPSFYKYFDKIIAYKILKDSWPFIFTALIISIYMKIDQIMMKSMLDEKSVGLYSVAVLLSTAWYFVPTVIANSFFPAIVNSRKNITLYRLRIQNLFTALVWISILAALFTTFFSNYIILIMFGQTYEPASDALKIHIWGGLAVAFGIMWSKWILVENLQKHIVIFHLISMILNICLNYFLIPTYGIEGAAMATVIASSFAQTMGILFFKRKLALQFLIKSIFPFYLINKRL